MDAIGNIDVRWIQGFSEHSSVDFIDTETVCYVCGNHMVFLNVVSKQRTVLRSPGGRGIGVFTANGASKVLAVSEQRLNPSVFVLSYPECQLINELKGTAKLDYTSLVLSNSGPYLCCCSSLPDHTITVWNWETAEMICSQPQAGKDVVSLVFNPMNWQQIVALGSTTLTVWTIDKSDTYHIMKKRELHLPAANGSLIKTEAPPSHVVSSRLTCWGPQMPRSAIAGLPGDIADRLLSQEGVAPRLAPVAVCWTPSAELYVGCRQGYLLLVNPEGPSVSVLFNPTEPDADPVLKKDSFQSLALHRDGLYAAGKDGLLHCLKVIGTRVKVSQTLDVKESIRTVVFSPDYKYLLLASSSGQISRHQPLRSGSLDNILDVLTGNFIASASLSSCQDAVVSLRELGHLQRWSSDGILTGSLFLQTQVSCLACCPVSNYAVVGTSSGHLLFVDLSSAGPPRLVHRIHLDRQPVDHLVFDQGGNVLLATSGSHIFILEAKPSTTFAIIGYTVAPGGPVLSLSVQFHKDSKRVQVLALCPGPKDRWGGGGSLLHLLSLSLKELSGPRCVDAHGRLSDNTLHTCTYQAPHALQSCVLGLGEVLAYCQEDKALQRFRLPPQDAGGAPGPSVCQLRPEEEVESHPVGPVLLALSPQGSWLASVGRDGLLRLRNTAALDRYTELQCHSCRFGGAGSVSFSADGQTLLTTGLADGSLVCTGLRTNVADAGQAQEEKHHLENILAAGEVRDAEMERDEKDTVLTSDPTWLEAREEASRGRMLANEALPEMWRLEAYQFNLDVSEQRRLEVNGEREVATVRNEVELGNLAKRYLCDLLKRHCWDSMKVKGRAVKGFHSDFEVKNYPMKCTEKELEALLRVESIRAIETANSILGCSSPHLYDQFNLHVREQKVDQITMLQDVIYKVKTAFNGKFDGVCKQKEQETRLVREKNRCMGEILERLGVHQELWEPSLGDSERPERAFTVEDSEIKVEQHLPPERKKMEEEKKELEEQARLAAKEDSSRDRALEDMMGGAIKVKKEDILKKEVPEPEFVGRKAEQQWSDEEKIIYKDYEKKAKELSEEQDKHRKTLESEIKKMQASIVESTQGFDEILAKLFERKVKSDTVIYQEELKIAHLVYSMLVEEEIRHQERDLVLTMERRRADKNQMCEELKNVRQSVELCREAYDMAVAEDRLLDKGFRKQFLDVPAHVVDHLYKLYKHRPRVQRMRAQADSNCFNPFKDGPWRGGAASDGLGHMLQAMEELDSPENSPSALEPAAWERFSLVRKAKVESEQQVKVKALTLAETQAFLQKRSNEDEATKQQLKTLMDELNGLREHKVGFQLDLLVQVLLRQGQVEASPALFIGHHRDSTVMHHRSVVEDLNNTIQTLGEQKMAIMVECKDFRWTTYLDKTDPKMVDQDSTPENHTSLGPQGTVRQVSVWPAALKAEQNTALDRALVEMEVAVSKRRLIYEATAEEDDQEKERSEIYRDIVQLKTAKHLARTQARDLASLRDQLEVARMKNFPALN
ncbi:hypothetical protein NHX12_021982 [Muraenolepis orangiensis]|uniref:Cilia- and flagella-associated protein 43 n=1 Tax=Muraenolepis orangiensis TaxID=630683 RepID=A0A9Q0EQQ6_9TELE|nr:hypothetical protein NHX12_021982 [Muraenolepis orangiensis]